MLRGLARLWDLSPDENRLDRIGLGLGADVPMCLAARPLLARGIGEAFVTKEVELTTIESFLAGALAGDHS